MTVSPSTLLGVNGSTSDADSLLTPSAFFVQLLFIREIPEVDFKPKSEFPLRKHILLAFWRCLIKGK